MEKYLPIGSIVLLRGGEKRVMVYGRMQNEVGTDRVWDYIACLYPEGNLTEKFTYLFDHEQVERVYFVGFQDDEEFEFAATRLRADPFPTCS